MHSQIDLTEGSTAKHLSYPVEGYISQWRLASLSESILQLLHHVAYFLGSGAKLAKFAFIVDGFLCADDFAKECFLVDVGGDLANLLFIVLSD